MNEYMSTNEAAKLWGVDRATVQKWCREGKLKNGVAPCYQEKKGSPWFIRRDAIPPRRGAGAK